ncbi:MAG: glycosyltransferase [Candidatus Krumholzibacteriia bacterium]
MRILLIAANFAPRTGSHPTRTVHLAKYLHRLGHSVKVITYEVSQHELYAEPDASLTAKVPADVEVRRVRPGWLHRLLASAKRRGRKANDLKRRGGPLAALMIPDPHCSARGAFLAAAREVIAAWPPDLLITCAYPFTITLVGATLRRENPRLVWIADHGDPWTGSPVPELRLPAWRRTLDRRLESRALARADAVTVTTAPTAQLYRQQFPALSERIHVVTMGYDPEDVDGVVPAPRSSAEQGKLVLLHAGRLYGTARNPRPLVAAIERCLAAEPDLPERLRIVLLGEVAPDLAALIRRSPAAGIFALDGWVTVQESLARMKAADALLLFGNLGAMQIPGKVYQYMATGRPILMTCETEADPTLDVLQRYGNTMVVPNRPEELAAALRLLMADPVQLAPSGTGCDEFGWPALAARLVAIAESAGARGRDRNAEVPA